MKTLRFFLCISLIAALFIACEKGDKPLKPNSLTVSNTEFTGCVEIEDLTKAGQDGWWVPHTIVLEAQGDVLKILRQSRFNCGAKLDITVTNEGNTITIQEKNVGLSAMCDCPGEYQSEIKGMKDGIYTICVFPFKSYYGYFKPFVFEFKEGVKQTVELDLIYYNYLDLL